MGRSLVGVLVVAVVMVAAGCGSDDTDPALQNQIQTFADQQLALRLDPNESAEPFSCEEDGDAEQWTCTTEIQVDNPGDADDEVVPVSVNVTCAEADRCVYEPET